ncbi:dipeptidase [Rhodoluna limnophila]|uniref:dipeptidase n=1 Tax=Rhodoluna limnophila TaxID=232537 RepID=UPI0011059557|nr:dipeptidase [Rhodoluna limnophila]
MTPVPDSEFSRFAQDSASSVDNRFEATLTSLMELAKVPGIAWEAFDSSHLDTSAQMVSDLFRNLNIFDFVEVRRSAVDGKPGAPAVIARRAAKNGKPQVLLYAHHDVQPPGNSDEWKTNPFNPVRTEDRIFGRGVADDKAGIVAHLAALQALVDSEGKDFDLGISLFIEGEEEAGSPTFRNFLEENQADLAADVIIVADSGNWTTEVPALTTTLRGLVSVVVQVKTLDHAVHSGMYGGAVPDAMLAMIKLLASLHDDQGDVAVTGLKSAQTDELAYSEDSLRQDSGLLPKTQTIGSGGILQRIWGKPAITVIGIDGQTVALSSNTLLPSVRAKISMRIAPGQDPAEAMNLLKAHLLSHTPFGAELSFGEVELGKPFNMDDSGWAAQLVKKSLAHGWREAPVNIGIGGSIPFIADLTEVFPAAQILVTGVEDPDSRAHSPNESVHIESLRKAMVSEAIFLLAGNELQL